MTMITEAGQTEITTLGVGSTVREYGALLGAR